MEKPRQLQCTSNHYGRMIGQAANSASSIELPRLRSPIWFQQHTATRQEDTHRVSAKQRSSVIQQRQPSDEGVVLVVNVSILRQVRIVRSHQLYREKISIFSSAKHSA